MDYDDSDYGEDYSDDCGDYGYEEGMVNEDQELEDYYDDYVTEGDEMSCNSNDSSVYSHGTNGEYVIRKPLAKISRAPHAWKPCTRRRRASFGCDDLMRSREQRVESMIETCGLYYWHPDDSYIGWNSIITQCYYKSIFYAEKYGDVSFPDIYEDIQRAMQQRERDDLLRRIATNKRKHRGKKHHAKNIIEERKYYRVIKLDLDRTSLNMRKCIFHSHFPNWGFLGF